MKACFGLMFIGALMLACVSLDARAQPACTYTVTPTTFDFDVRGGTAEIRVTASKPACTFNAQSAYPWITLSFSQERGEGVVKAVISGNTSMTHRVGDITIDGKRVTITQYGPRITGGG